MLYRDDRGVYRASLLETFDWLEHGFGSRAAGRWTERPLATVKQVHSGRFLEADGRPGCLGEADAILTRAPGLLVGVFTADCLPVLLVDPQHRAVAAVHAGWRGLVCRILTSVVEGMSRRYGSDPGALLAVVGPAICGRCYEVGPEVARQFARWFPERRDLDRKTLLDLPEAARRQLLQAGLADGHVLLSGLCTFCGGDEFCSHRRAPGRAGRMLSAVGIRV